MSGESSSPLLDLYSLSVCDLEDENPLFQKISESFLCLKRLLGFSSVDNLRTFFQPDDFKTIEDVSTFYGRIKCCPVSQRLFKRFMKRIPSLQSISAFYLSLNKAMPGVLDNVFQLPDNLALVILSVSLLFGHA